MRASRNELIRTCHKAFEVLGFPPGADRDAAYMVAWLEAHGLPGLRPLHAELPALRRGGVRAPERVEVTPEGPVLDARGAPALTVASAALDLACADAHASARGRGQVLVGRCRYPLYAAGLLVQRARSSGCILSLSWTQQGALRDFVVAQDGAPSLFGGVTDLERSATDACDVHVRCTRADAAGLANDPSGRGRPPSLDAETFAAREAQGLAAGIEVPEDAWRELVALAESVLVTATEQSRLGAGSRGSDSD